MEAAETEIFLCDADDVTEGEPHRVEVVGRPPVAVYKVGGDVYVTDDICSHGQASLGDEGEQDGFNIICTWHDGVFDIRTGEPQSMPCTKPIKTYRAVVRGGGIHILVAA